MMPLGLFRSFPLKEAGFGLDTEITARILRTGARPFEVPVSYHSRSKAQGKKISWRDGVECLHILWRVRRAPLRSIATPDAVPATASTVSRLRAADGHPRPLMTRLTPDVTRAPENGKRAVAS
jgi:dolichol-phosphate hexosyltransferase